MSNYLIELAAVHTVLMLGYWFFLRKERQYPKMRFYLVASTLLALIIPFLKLPRLLFGGNEPLEAVPMGIIRLESMAVTSTVEASTWPYDILVWIYFTVSGYLLFKFLSGIVYLVRLERRSRHERFNDMTIRRAAGIKGSFTFFHWIFLSDQIDPGQRGYEVILKHEKAHASLGHTYDLLLFGLFKICFWWLPTAWIITKEIKKIHEYQADAVAIKSCDVDQYSSILISSTLKTSGLVLASSFHDGLILKRLKAMKQQAKKISLWKLGALSALCVSLIIVFACSEETDREIKELGSQSNTIAFEQLPAAMQKDLADIKDGLSFLKLEVLDEKKISDIKELKDLDPNLIYSINVQKDETNKTIYLAIKKDAANFDYLSDKAKMDGDVFTIVESQPEFEGGISGFRGYVAKAIKYPLEARNKGVEGRVDVQFVVEKDGSLSEVKAINGIGAGCDEEAVKVVQNSPRFKPGTQNGKPVRVRMVVPIMFQLDETKVNPDNSKQGVVIIEEVQSQNSKFTVEASFANGEWSGKVLDEDGNALPGVNILVAGTTSGTVSNQDGSFKLKADPSQELNFSFVGYENMRIRKK